MPVFIYELCVQRHGLGLRPSEKRIQILHKLYEEEVEKIRRDFINKNFGDLTSKEKDILLENLIKAEHFSSAERL